MTHDELIKRAIEESRANGITEELLRARIREAAVVYFDTRGPDGRYEITINLHTGDFISATLSHTGLPDDDNAA